MKMCKVYPTKSQCSECVDTWELFGGDVSQMPDCKDLELVEKDEWIHRLLEYMDMSEEDMKKIIQKDKTMAEAAERLSDIDRMVSLSFW